MRRRLFPAALAGLLLAGGLPRGAAAGTDASALQFVRGLYAHYQQGAPSGDFLAPGAALFDSHLLALMRRDRAAAGGEVGLLDGDPICNCQDHGDMNVTKADVLSSDGRHARVAVTVEDAMVQGPERVSQHVFSLVDGGRGWRIADIGSPDMPSLARFLEQGLRRAGAQKPH